MTAAPIVFPLSLELPHLTPYAVWNIAAALICSIALAVLVWTRPTSMARFAVIVAGGVNILFQWPMALFSTPIEQSLADPVFFSLCAHLTVAFLVAWSVGVPSLQWTGPDRSEVSTRQIVPPVAVLFGLLGIFLLLMPAQCTALYAMLFDPSNTLLAREVTIKLAGSTIATSSYGAVANAAAPATAGMSLLLMMQGARSKRFSLVLLCLLLVAASFAAALIGGAKGLLVPLAIVVIFAAVGTYRSLWIKLAALVVTVACLASLLAAFEVLRERGGRDIPYDFAGCVVTLGTVDQGRELLQSMATGGLTMSPRQIEALTADLENSGGRKLPPVVIPAAKPPTTERAATYLNAIAYRAFVTPIQGAAWHHLYVEEHGTPGIGTLPLALKLFGASVDATSLVYHAYGVTFSGGDATSTSTTPTSYVFAYPAYFGWLGLLTVIVLTVGVDVVASLAIRRSNRAVRSVGAGLLAVIAFNASTSDLYTVMVSHGGAAALLLIILMGWTRRAA